MADFNSLIDKIIQLEGGYVNNLADPGGETRYGISKKSYPAVDIKNLTLDKAKSIYYDSYWIPASINNIENNDLTWKEKSLLKEITNIDEKLKKIDDNIFRYSDSKEEWLSVCKSNNPTQCCNYVTQDNYCKGHQSLCVIIKKEEEDEDNDFEF